MSNQLLDMIQPANLGLGNSQYWERIIKLDEIKLLLDDNNDKKIMEGLKLLLAAMSKGTNVQVLFPQVAKLVARQNPEIKKMVYIYLGQYAELEQTAALLAINILKKDLSHTNQLVRAHALRTISSLRVRIIIQLVVVAVVGGTKDTSPYVRKTAAHGILKVYSMDTSHKDVLVEAIERLLADKETSVLGSAVAAFNEVCPDRFDLIHKHFRKFCDTLVDTEEWGQVHILNMLTRYARSQFVDPEKEVEKEDKEGEEEEEDDFMAGFDDLGGFTVEPDHRILLESCVPLLKSRNPSVVMAVAQLYQYCAPRTERHKVAKALVRCMRDSREVAYLILTYINSMVQKDPSLFQTWLADFFVTNSDPTFCRTLKLSILTNLANDSNIDRILREFKFYATQDDKEFVAATIQCIGKCAMRLPEVIERCMSHLMHLLSSKNEIVVAESVVVMKQLLQMPREEEVNYDDVIKQLTRLITKVTNAKARASIIWVVGEYVDTIKEYAPDILRQLAKDFPTETDAAKVQILNLAAKLMFTNPEQSALIAQYIFHMAKFDLNYDIRDKARIMRFMLFPDPSSEPRLLSEKARNLILTQKPSPMLASQDEDGLLSKYMIGTLSHVVKHVVPGYNPLPDWSLEPTDPELRKPPARMMSPSSISSIGSGDFGGRGGPAGRMVGFGSNTGGMPGYGPGGYGPGGMQGGGYGPGGYGPGGRPGANYSENLDDFYDEEYGEEYDEEYGEYDEEYEGEYGEEEYGEGEYGEGEYEGEYGEEGEYEGEYDEGEYEGEYEGDDAEWN